MKRKQKYLWKEFKLIHDDKAAYTRLKSIYGGILRRCYSKESKYYHRYGGRGILVCDEWRHNFYLFYLWATQNGYSEKLQIDRIDNNAGYSPDNCRFVAPYLNQRNTYKNRFLEYNGQIKPLVEWAEEKNLNEPSLRYRIRNGWPIEKALTTPTGKNYIKRVQGKGIR